MTVKELIELLQKEEPDRLVVLAKHSTGNGYSPASGVWAAKYQSRTDVSGEVGLETLTEELKQAGYTAEDVLVNGVRAVILSPLF